MTPGMGVQGAIVACCVATVLLVVSIVDVSEGT